MGRSTSCLKIITCGSDSTDKNDPDVSESKSSSDKRGWSFRKRSARHRVLSNTVISETASSANKGSPESVAPNFQQLDNSTVPEKVSLIQCTEEELQFPVPVDSKISEPVPADSKVPELVTVDSEVPEPVPVDLKVPETLPVESDEPEPVSMIVGESHVDCKVDDKLEESVVIVIQTCIRGFLAQRELLKLQKVVKLQAAVRGHLVRRHAVGTLRCVQAIVKMQALVRARRARLSMEESCMEKKSDTKLVKDSSNAVTLEKENSGIKPKAISTSIEKLLSNRFARQLMQSTPKAKPINIKCDPSKPNSAWSWLERWMSVSSVEQTGKPESVTERPDKENSENIVSPVGILTEVSCESTDSKPGKETGLPLESEENMITYNAEKFSFEAGQTTDSSVRDNVEQAVSVNGSKSNAKEISGEINSHSNQSMESDLSSRKELSSVPKKPELESEQAKRSVKRNASEQLETEGKRFVAGSRKTSNPAFIAVQSKFEELSSTANSSRSISSSYQDVIESKSETVSSWADAVKRTKKPSFAEDGSDSMRVQYGGSECGTELSISSTLDSPDRSEVGVAEDKHEARVAERENCNYTITETLNIEAKESSATFVGDLSPLAGDQLEKLDHAKDESDNSAAVVDSSKMEQKPERSTTDVPREIDSETHRQAYRSSPEASPRSHLTLPESQGTPSSQLSVKAKKNKADKGSSNQKRKSLSASKGSPANPNHDSGLSNMEQLPRDQKSGKRRNSFGSTRAEQIEQEPRDSGSSSSLPHFMQATESARAKVNSNNSPRSSPDVQDREIYIKKRHSLPAANGRQSSPRIQRTTSQAQQGGKGNGTHPLHERKWQR